LKIGEKADAADRVNFSTLTPETTNETVLKLSQRPVPK
jgi:hypothetical protein